jgi:hypothetical protein
MAAMAIRVAAIFSNSLRGRPHLLFGAILSVGRAPSRRRFNLPYRKKYCMVAKVDFEAVGEENVRLCKHGQTL